MHKTEQLFGPQKSRKHYRSPLSISSHFALHPVLFLGVALDCKTKEAVCGGVCVGGSPSPAFITINVTNHADICDSLCYPCCHRLPLFLFVDWGY